MHVCHAAAAEHLVHLERLGRVGVDVEYQSVGAYHVALVAAGVEVTDESALQVPRRADAHGSLVVAAEEAAYLEGVARRLCEARVVAHLIDALGGEELAAIACMGIRGIYDAVHHLAGVVHIDDGLLRHRSVVAAAEGIHDGAADDL